MLVVVVGNGGMGSFFSLLVVIYPPLCLASLKIWSLIKWAHVGGEGRGAVCAREQGLTLSDTPSCSDLSRVLLNKRDNPLRPLESSSEAFTREQSTFLCTVSCICRMECELREWECINGCVSCINNSQDAGLCRWMCVNCGCCGWDDVTCGMLSKICSLINQQKTRQAFQHHRWVWPLKKKQRLIVWEVEAQMILVLFKFSGPYWAGVMY